VKGRVFDLEVLKKRGGKKPDVEKKKWDKGRRPNGAFSEE